MKVKTAKCPACGGQLIKLAGQYSALSYDKCKKCRDAEATGSSPQDPAAA